MDTTNDFHDALNEWNNLKKVTDEDIALLITNAQGARSAADSAWEWATLEKHLIDVADYSKEEAKAEARKARIMASLGKYPSNAAEFVVAWLNAKGYRMNYKGDFEGPGGTPVGLDHILDEMKIWTEEKGAFKSTFEPAVRLWVGDERKVIMIRTFGELSYDPSLDPDMIELQKWVDLILAVDPDPELHERNRRGAITAMRNFIHRVKNHIGAYAGLKHPSGDKRWHHHTHVMPVLYGAQEDGKTLAVKSLLRALEDLTTGMGFELLEDNSKQNMLSYVPVMTFDELAGLKNANVEKLKGIMTEETRSLREIYGKASPKTLITTFVGCTNEDINGLIRDKSGNRRFYQVMTRKVDVDAMLAVDARKIWKSVDENAPSPWYASLEDLAIVKEVQAEGRHKSSVEDWLENCRTIPRGEGFNATTEFYASYFEYVEEFHQSEAKMANVIRFGRELNRLAKTGHKQIEQEFNRKTKSNCYRITPNDAVMTLRDELVARKKAMAEDIKKPIGTSRCTERDEDGFIVEVEKPLSEGECLLKALNRHLGS